MKIGDTKSSGKIVVMTILILLHFSKVQIFGIYVHIYNIFFRSIFIP